MRNDMLRPRDERSVDEHRQLRRAAVRHLDRAGVYIAASTFMDLGDPAVERELGRLRSDLEGIRRRIANGPAAAPE